MSDVIELVGLGVTGWFIYRYLVRTTPRNAAQPVFLQSTTLVRPAASSENPLWLLVFGAGQGLLNLCNVAHTDPASRRHALPSSSPTDRRHRQVSRPRQRLIGALVESVLALR